MLFREEVRNIPALLERQTGESVAEAVSFRRPMGVTQVKVFGGTGWPVCPRCALTMEREYMAFCDRCGQRLNWRRYRDAQLIYPNPR